MALTAEQKAGVEAIILEYLMAEGGRFAHTVAAFQEELQLPSSPPPDYASDAEPTVFETLAKYGQQCGYHLFHAIREVDTALVKQLSRFFGAFQFNAHDIIGDFDHTSPLSFAIEEDKMEMVEIMLENGIHPDESRPSDGRYLTALQVACDYGRADIVRLLVEKGANVEIKDDENKTPVIHAIESNSLDVVQYLLDFGCDRDRVDDNGWTYLHFAAYHGHLEIAQLLMRYGAKLDALTNSGELPADLADEEDIVDAIEAEEIRRRDHGFKRDRSTIPGTEEYEAAKRPRVEQQQEAAVDESDDDDDDDDDDDGDDED